MEKRFQTFFGFSSSDYRGRNIGDKRLDKQIISLPDDFSFTSIYSPPSWNDQHDFPNLLKNSLRLVDSSY